MSQEQYNQRKQYVEQAKNSFSGQTQEPTDDTQPRSFFKLRLGIALLLFFGFLFLKQTDTDIHGIDAGLIQQKIEQSINLFSD